MGAGVFGILVRVGLAGTIDAVVAVSIFASCLCRLAPPSGVVLPDSSWVSKVSDFDGRCLPARDAGRDAGRGTDSGLSGMGVISRASSLVAAISKWILCPGDHLSRGGYI